MYLYSINGHLYSFAIIQNLYKIYTKFRHGHSQKQMIFIPYFENINILYFYYIQSVNHHFFLILDNFFTKKQMIFILYFENINILHFYYIQSVNEHFLRNLDNFCTKKQTRFILYLENINILHLECKSAFFATFR